MDSMWTNLLRQDERCCLAICLAVNCPHSGLTDDTWYPPLNRVKEDMNSTAGDRFIAYIISCLCGPLQGKEFVVKVAALLACLKVREAPEECDDGLPGNRTNLLFEFDKALNFDFGNMLITIKVLEQVLMFSARIWEIHAPEDTVHPGTLPATFDLCDDSVSRKMLYMYCCVRVLFPDTHEATMHRTRAVFQMSSADAAELFLDTLSDDELESGGHSMCDVDELGDDDGGSDVSGGSCGPDAEEDDSDIE
ncbi:hypothetical protein CTAM01_17078 [Colletotrichum tamarilloi]|uniref:Uncharacterized protein n=1 Tax=Colletotrichum tamarilloi TaxID=1209934 RepID=A0ABQ9QH14_9PEZI|nr:uncharacterized protein CTAM01_17078 [Colletotrichum tamarilloi]KAK1463835.1 hypothetical protein CTAM01_17078 [Colletotrichum tamarilloi]